MKEWQRTIILLATLALGVLFIVWSNDQTNHQFTAKSIARLAKHNVTAHAKSSTATQPHTVIKLPKPLQFAPNDFK